MQQRKDTANSSAGQIHLINQTNPILRYSFTRIIVASVAEAALPHWLESFDMFIGQQKLYVILQKWLYALWILTTAAAAGWRAQVRMDSRKQERRDSSGWSCWHENI